MQVVGCCGADYTFFQTYHSYVNPTHRRGTGQCCDSQDMPPCPEFSSCDNIFTLCAQSSQQPLPETGEDIGSDDCPLGFGVSQTFSNSDNIAFNTSVPVSFTGESWPVSSYKPYSITHNGRVGIDIVGVQGSFRLVVQVYDDDDGNPDDFVDTLVMERPLSPSDFYTSPTNYTSTQGIFSLVISFRVECSESE